MGTAKDALQTAFRGRRVLHKSTVVLFGLLNGIVLFNALFHDPTVGYDASEHLKNIQILAQGRLPRPEESAEFFSPPLPYLPPALLQASGCFSFATVARAAQLFNAFYSLVLTFVLLLICELLRPGSGRLKSTTLLLLGMLPVYYKSFAFVRGEPLLALLAVLAVYQALRVLVQGADGLFQRILLGVWVGLLPLGRQWGILLAGAIVVFALALLARNRQQRRERLRALAAILLLAPAISGWFYLHLLTHYGRLTAFNRPPAAAWSLANQSRDFYLGLSLGRLFRDPVRVGFPNRLVPIFYAETWGDYWGYFVIYVRDGSSFLPGAVLEQAATSGALAATLRTNRYAINHFLGRVNLVSLLPTAILLGGLGMALVQLIRRRGSAAGALLVLVVAFSVGGYLWFLIGYPNPGKGDTIKATYMLQVFPFLALLGSDWLQRMRQWSVRTWRITAALLLLVALHNLPALFTHCW